MNIPVSTVKTLGISLGILGILAFLGLGCVWFKSGAATGPNMAPAGPKPANLDNVTPAEASKRINLVQGSRIMLRHTYLGQSAQQEASQAGDSLENVRVITVERFAPEHVAALGWTLNQRVETDASKKAREEYDKKLAEDPDKAGKEPEVVTEVVSVNGRILDLNLKNSHGLYLPAYWPAEKTPSQDTSGIWLSRTNFEELTTTRNSTLYFNLFEPSFYERLANSKDFKQAMDSLDAQRKKVEGKTDPDIMKSETELSDWTLKVNGKDTKVQVLKAKSWYGEIVVLNNVQNPLVIKLNLDPAISNPFLQTLMGYEVTELEGVE